MVRQLFYSEEKRKIDNNFKNPYLFTESQSEIKLIEKINNPNIMSIFDIYTSSKRQREAFVYLIKKLRDNDIKVIIIQMPINPLVSKKLNQKYVEDFHNYLKKVSTTYNIPLINLEDNFPKEEFIDLTHLNQQGRENLSQRIESLGMQEKIFKVFQDKRGDHYSSYLNTQRDHRSVSHL